MDGCGDGLGHVVYGAEGYAIEGGLQGFGAGGVDFCFQAEGADGFAEEGGFFVLGFGQGYGDFWADEGYGDSWEAGSGAEIQ